MFWAQLLQKKQINYPHRGRGERQRDKSNTRLMKDGKIKDKQNVSWSILQEILTSFFVGKGQVQIHVPSPALKTEKQSDEASECQHDTETEKCECVSV